MGIPLIRRITFLLTASALLCCSCSPTLKGEQHLGALQPQEAGLPHQVAILPFQNQTDELGIDQLVRRSFANHFTAKNFRELKLPAVDEKVVLFEKSTGKKVEEAGADELSTALGCDGLLYGRVTSYQRLYAALYSRFAVEAEVWLVNASTGKELFRVKEEVRYHEGGVPTSPLSALVTVVSTAMNLREIQKVRLVNELSYKLTERIRGPASLAAAGRPAIKEVQTNLHEGPFGVKKVVRVALEGEPGQVATFDIGSFRKGIPMREISPGVYSGEYAVLPGDEARDMPVSASLTRPGEVESQWFDGAYATIDTTAPAAVTALKAKGLPDRVRLEWPALKETGDLKGYRIMRSSQPLSGYRELAVVEEPTYEDFSAAKGAPSYYRVTALDRAGNESPQGNAAAALLTAAGPVPLAGEVAADTLLAGECLVDGEVTVPRGVTLSLAPGTMLRFPRGAGLLVLGKLAAAGDEAEPVELLPAGKERWKGVVLQGAAVDLTGVRVVGAENAFTLSEARGSITDTRILNSGTALTVSGVAPLTISGCSLSGNEVAAVLAKSDTAFVGNSVVNNKTGVTLESFVGELRDNNIFGNEINLSGPAGSQIGINFFGSSDLEQMRLSGVSPEQVYDGKYPGGKRVTPLANPYRELAPEERRIKGTELLVEAGRYFAQRNFGRAATLFAEHLRVDPSPEGFYYLALCHLEMKEPQKTLAYLEEGTVKFPQDSMLWRALGMLSYENGEPAAARKALEESLRLSPDDRQARFILEMLTAPQAAASESR